MKGVIFNLTEKVLVAEHGEDAWDTLLELTGLEGAYTSLGSYPDHELAQLLDAASAATGEPVSELLRWIGRRAMPRLAAHYPDFFRSVNNGRDFILSVNDIIHPEVRKLYAGAACPHFRLATAQDGALSIGYASPRKLCDLAHGFIEGAADHYGETVRIKHDLCMLKDDPVCRLTVRWVQ